MSFSYMTGSPQSHFPCSREKTPNPQTMLNVRNSFLENKKHNYFKYLNCNLTEYYVHVHLKFCDSNSILAFLFGLLLAVSLDD